GDGRPADELLRVLLPAQRPPAADQVDPAPERLLRERGLRDDDGGRDRHLRHLRW
ncbi:unnamed protein product, partial [Heterosigma akashiwo]